MDTRNYAAYLMEAHAKDMTIKETAIPTPEPHEVVIRNRAVAINPVDWKIQDYGVLVESYPFIIGCDSAGIVHSVGSSVTKFQPGDRVAAHHDGLSNKKPENNAFQHYSKTDQVLMSKLPEKLSFAQGSVLGVAFSTASAVLFQKEHLGLELPSVPATKLTGADKVVLIWGGSSSVGSCAIQLARAAGVQAVTTASTRNHAYVKGLGASHVFDHASPTVVADIVDAIKETGKEFAGAVDTVTIEATVRACAEIAGKLDGKKLVAMVMQLKVDGLPEGVVTKGVYGLSVARNEVGPAVWGDYLPLALEDGSFQPKPDPLVVGQGLEMLQGGLRRQKAGVSAQKVVVELD